MVPVNPLQKNKIGPKQDLSLTVPATENKHRTPLLAAGVLSSQESVVKETPAIGNVPKFTRALKKKSNNRGQSVNIEKEVELKASDEDVMVVKETPFIAVKIIESNVPETPLVGDDQFESEDVFQDNNEAQKSNRDSSEIKQDMGIDEDEITDAKGESQFSTEDSDLTQTPSQLLHSQNGSASVDRCCAMDDNDTETLSDRKSSLESEKASLESEKNENSESLLRQGHFDSKRHDNLSDEFNFVDKQGSDGLLRPAEYLKKKKRKCFMLEDDKDASGQDSDIALSLGSGKKRKCERVKRNGYEVKEVTASNCIDLTNSDSGSVDIVPGTVTASLSPEENTVGKSVEDDTLGKKGKEFRIVDHVVPDGSFKSLEIVGETLESNTDVERDKELCLDDDVIDLGSLACQNKDHGIVNSQMSTLDPQDVESLDHAAKQEYGSFKTNKEVEEVTVLGNNETPFKSPSVNKRPKTPNLNKTPRSDKKERKRQLSGLLSSPTSSVGNASFQMSPDDIFLVDSEMPTVDASPDFVLDGMDSPSSSSEPQIVKRIILSDLTGDNDSGKKAKRQVRGGETVGISGNEHLCKGQELDTEADDQNMIVDVHNVHNNSAKHLKLVPKSTASTPKLFTPLKYRSPVASTKVASIIEPEIIEERDTLNITPVRPTRKTHFSTPIGSARRDACEKRMTRSLTPNVSKYSPGVLKRSQLKLGAVRSSSEKVVVVSFDDDDANEGKSPDKIDGKKGKETHLKDVSLNDKDKGKPTDNKEQKETNIEEDGGEYVFSQNELPDLDFQHHQRENDDEDSELNLESSDLDQDVVGDSEQKHDKVHKTDLNLEKSVVYVNNLIEENEDELDLSTQENLHTDKKESENEDDCNIPQKSSTEHDQNEVLCDDNASTTSSEFKLDSSDEDTKENDDVSPEARALDAISSFNQLRKSIENSDSIIPSSVVNKQLSNVKGRSKPKSLGNSGNLRAVAALKRPSHQLDLSDSEDEKEVIAESDLSEHGDHDDNDKECIVVDAEDEFHSQGNNSKIEQSKASVSKITTKKRIDCEEDTSDSETEETIKDNKRKRIKSKKVINLEELNQDLSSDSSEEYLAVQRKRVKRAILSDSSSDEGRFVKVVFLCILCCFAWRNAILFLF